MAFSDESSHNSGRFRGIGVVSFPKERLDMLLEKLGKLIKESDVSEIKWKKIRTAKYRFAAIKVIDLVIDEAVKGNLRVDVIIWDTEDSRHKIVGRDDNENLRWMYFQLFRNVLRLRWSSNSKWILFPDENSIINWQVTHGKLNTAAKFIELEKEETHSSKTSMFRDHENYLDTFADQIKSFNVLEILEVNSTNTLLSQVADLFVGVGVFSHQQYYSYDSWCLNHSPQMRFEFMEINKTNFTPKEDEHCFVLNHLSEGCKQAKFAVSLNNTNGLFTRNPSKPMNFWLYQPQGEYDKAPVRKK